MTETRTTSSSGPRTLISLAAFVVVVAGMMAAKPILVPFLMAVFLAVIAAPALTWLQRRGVRRGLALIAVLTAVVFVISMLVSLIGGEIDRFSDELPRLQEQLRTAKNDLMSWSRRELPDQFASKMGLALKDLDPGKAIGVGMGMLSGITNMATNAFLIVLTMLFILVEASSFPSKLRAASKNPDEAIREVNEMLNNVNRYMGLKTLMSLLTGIIVALWLAMFGLDFVLLFGMLAFLLNFIPNLGSILAALPAVAWALVPAAETTEVRPGLALLVALGYLIANVVVGNVLEPRLMGRGLGLSTLVVFLSLVFWGWVLGPVGMLLSVPLTVSLKIVLAAKEQTKWIAVLLGPEDSAHKSAPISSKVVATVSPDLTPPSD